MVVIDTLKNEVVHEFHTYIKPTAEKLDPFCTELCGITEEMVYGEEVPTFSEALNQLHEFLEKNGILKEEFVLVSCGDYDGNQLKREFEFKNVFRPNYLKRWINLKKVCPTYDQINASRNGAQNLGLVSDTWNDNKRIK